jgi:OOP family OmpA-OmpF porin
MKRLLLYAVTFIILTLLATSAVSAGEEIGWYAGIGAGSSNDQILQDRDTGMKLFGGVQLSDYFGMEAAYVDLGDFTFGLLDQSGVAVEVVGSAPVGEQLTFFAKAGMFSWDVKLSGMEADHGISSVFGAGFQWALAENWAFRGDYERFNDVSGGDVALVAIGVLYRSKV